MKQPEKDVESDPIGITQEEAFPARAVSSKNIQMCIALMTRH